MNVSWHDDVAVDSHSIEFPGSLQELEKDVARGGLAEDGLVTDTTEGDVVKVTGLLVAL